MLILSNKVLLDRVVHDCGLDVFDKTMKHARKVKTMHVSDLGPETT